MNLFKLLMRNVTSMVKKAHYNRKIYASYSCYAAPINKACDEMNASNHSPSESKTKHLKP